MGWGVGNPPGGPTEVVTEGEWLGAAGEMPAPGGDDNPLWTGRVPDHEGAIRDAVQVRGRGHLWSETHGMCQCAGYVGDSDGYWGHIAEVLAVTP